MLWSSDALTCFIFSSTGKNHDFDFGVKQFRNLTEKCNFPWLIANVLDPALGEDVPLGNAKRTHMLTTSNGIKVGLIGLGEREWLATINSLPPDLIYKSATATAKELVPQLREQGAEMVICLSHMREPNDNKLAEQTDGLIDIILGGHDHYYSHSLIKGTHVLRSGTDFKQLSYIEARRERDDAGRWDFDIWRRDVTSDVAEDERAAKLVGELTSKLQKSLSRPVGWTAVPLDARFSTVRTRESNLGNFVCDVMRRHHNADCTIMASGTIRGDQVYPPGVVRVKEITTCFPFEDPVVCLRVKGQAIWDALENSVSTYPAQEGRFPQVSNIVFEFDPSRESGKRLNSLQIGGRPYDPEAEYVLVTRGYMGRGKGGFFLFFFFFFFFSSLWHTILLNATNIASSPHPCYKYTDNSAWGNKKKTQMDTHPCSSSPRAAQPTRLSTKKTAFSYQPCSDSISWPCGQ